MTLPAIIVNSNQPPYFITSGRSPKLSDFSVFKCFSEVVEFDFEPCPLTAILGILPADESCCLVGNLPFCLLTSTGSETYWAALTREGLIHLPWEKLNGFFLLFFFMT